MNGSTGRTELVGTDLSLETATWDVENPWQPPRPGFVGRLHLGHETDVVDPVPVTFVVDGEPVTPRIISRTQSSTNRGRRCAFSTTAPSSERFISS